MIQAQEGRVRGTSVIAALVAYGVAALLQATVLVSVFGDNSIERLNVLGTLFTGMRPANLGPSQWLMLGLAAGLVGFLSGGFSAVTSRVLAKGVDAFSRLRGSRMLVGGVLIGLSVRLAPESFYDPSHLWDDIAWLRMSSANAFVVLLAEWTVFVLAFSSWGTAGVFSPLLLLGALSGYLMGNLVSSAWALPLAIVGSVSALSAGFRVPVAAAALILEIGRDGPLWALAILGVVCASFAFKLLKSKSLPELLLQRSGMRIRGGRASHLLANLKVSDAMYRDVRTIRDNATVQDLREAAINSFHSFLGVVTIDGKFLGLLALEHLPERIRLALAPTATFAEISRVERVVEIRDLVDLTSSTLHPDDNLEKALELLEGMPCVAVVDSERNLRGFLYESSIAGRYKREISRGALKTV
jgi:hypothetical protein